MCLVSVLLWCVNGVQVDGATGRATGETVSYAFSGKIRQQGEADDSLNRLAQADGILYKYVTFISPDEGRCAVIHMS